ncbi:MAG: hypothetical protein P9X26_07580 [Candidatus Stygibacter frigidus]|nr:hypothetical protein [Candidatus Stygibacter frigidus]
MINLGRCFNLLDKKYIDYLKYGYDFYVQSTKESGSELPKNKNIRNNEDKLMRHLDCAVIDFTLNYLESIGKKFDSVRGLFKEGEDIYPEAGFQRKNHIQISVRNPNCIKGYFRILSADKKFRLV